MNAPSLRTGTNVANRARRLAVVAMSVLLAGCASSPRGGGEARPSSRAWISASSRGPAAEPNQATALAKDAPHGGPAARFDDDVKNLFRVVACAGDEAMESAEDTIFTKRHCKLLRDKLERYERTYVRVAKPFLAELRPADVPGEVVYPFGGGDLVTALTTYPDARVVTTISLELAGDPRRLRDLHGMDLDTSLTKLRLQLDELIATDAFSKSETLKQTQRGDIPGELAFFLVGLAIHGFEPVSLRYFTFRADGTPHYLTDADIDTIERTLGERRKTTWLPPDFSEAFANSEITYRPRGSKDPSDLRVHRHVAQNLANGPLAESSLLAHLDQKGSVAAMTKAASYLLWDDGFSSIRTWLLEHAVFMVSDSTGIPPDFAQGSGFVQETYGSFTATGLWAPFKHTAAFRRLWLSQPRRPLPFTYGYHDSTMRDHLVVTKKPSAGTTTPTP